MPTATNKLASKPKLRGFFHQEAFFVALGACALLIAKSTSVKTLAAALVYSFGLLLLFGLSAIYHRPTWQPKARALLKRLDHCAIFILIAGTMTPLALLAMPGLEGVRLLELTWLTAIAGILQSIFWVKAPKWVTAILYVAAGWLALPYLHSIRQTLGLEQISLLVVGGVIYTVGAVFYALKRPNFVPGVFGYHELFHVFTILGAACHFIVVYRLII